MYDVRRCPTDPVNNHGDDEFSESDLAKRGYNVSHSDLMLNMSGDTLVKTFGVWQHYFTFLAMPSILFV